MSKNVSRELIKLVKSTPGVASGVKGKFLLRISQDKLSRSENPKSHFGTYFLPFNSQTKEVFLIHHKKSGLWLSPGGHMETGELPLETLIREAKEELGLTIQPQEINPPFLLTITPIDTAGYACQEHFDIWYLLKVDEFSINADPREFHQVKWLSIPLAKKLVTDLNSLKALEKISMEKSEKLATRSRDRYIPT